MSDKVKPLSEHQRKKKPTSLRGAMRRAAQQVRNVGGEKIKEPRGLASGNMKRFLDDPDSYDKEDDDGN